jgi:uncharacterized protein (TIGR02145 family)
MNVFARYLLKPLTAFAMLAALAAGSLWLAVRVKKTPEYARESASIVYGVLTDNRDGTVYKTVRMPDGRIWMVENLNYKPSSGNSLCYEDSVENCNKYGRLYDWGTAKNVCQDGWHLPSRDEWEALAVAVGGKKSYGGVWLGAGNKLMSMHGWNDNGNGFCNTRDCGGWWAATERDDDNACRWYIYYNDLNENYAHKSDALSVRCVKD